jgi:predicted DNA-binding protein (MmcQ/YjbR family)
MFGYSCYSISGKFFVGFANKNDCQVIVRLSKEQQVLAVKNKKIKPFSHGAKSGWIEFNTDQVTTNTAMKWILKAYEHAKFLAKNNRSATLL